MLEFSQLLHQGLSRQRDSSIENWTSGSLHTRGLNFLALNSVKDTQNPFSLTLPKTTEHGHVGKQWPRKHPS